MPRYVVAIPGQDDACSLAEFHSAGRQRRLFEAQRQEHERTSQ